MALIAGTLGADVINGTNADDTLLGYPEGTDASAETANDTISGSGGNDFEYGGGGNDQLNGGAGDDWLHGQIGSDILVGDAGYDHLFGGDGNDVLHGGTPTSVLQDGAGNSLNGEGGNDALYSLLGAGVRHDRWWRWGGLRGDRSFERNGRPDISNDKREWCDHA